MRTLLVVPWDQERGGVVSVVESLAQYLKARGHTVLFFHPGHTLLLHRRKTSTGFEGVQLRLGYPFAQPRPLVSALAFPFLFPIVLVQLIRFLRRERIEIVNLHFPIENFFYFALCRRLLRIRLITSVHGNDAFDMGRPKPRYSWAFRLILRASDRIVLPSDTYRKRLASIFPEIAERTTFIHNGVDPEQFKSGREASRPDSDRYILCIANLRVWKGVDVLLRAAEQLLKADPSLSVVIAGDGPLRGELEGLARSLGIESQARFLGSRGREEIAELLRACLVFVLPSREENCPVTIIEAMASRKAVVASAVGGIPEIVLNERSGLLVEADNPDALGEALRRVLTNDALRQEFETNGFMRAMEHFCLHHAGAGYETTYQTVLQAQQL